MKKLFRLLSVVAAFVCVFAASSAAKPAVKAGAVAIPENTKIYLKPNLAWLDFSTGFAVSVE